MKRDLQSSAPSAEQSDRHFDSPYLLTHEAAALLRFNTPHLFHKWAKRNRVPVLRRGRTLLYDRRVLEALLRLKPTGHGQTVAPRLAVVKSQPHGCKELVSR